LNLLFFDFGSGEIFLIVLVIFLVFGPDRIPEMARKFGKFINEIKRASEDIKTEINKEADKKEREKKLQEFRERIKTEEQVSNALPRKVTHIESIDSIDDQDMQTGEGRADFVEPEEETQIENKKNEDNPGQ
jgi:sec-independent protein translocase protein TatA